MDNNEMMNTENQPVAQAPEQPTVQPPVQQEQVYAQEQFEQPKKKSAGPIIAIAAAAIVLILAVAGVLAWKFGLFLKPADKVLIAAKNTFSEKDTIVTALSHEFEDKESATMKMEGEFNNYSGDFTMTVDKTGYGFDMNVHMPEMPTIAAVARLDAESFRMKAPALLDKVFVYDYHKTNENGLIAQQTGVKQLEEINKSLQQMVDACATIENAEAKQEELEGKLLEVYHELPFEKAEAAEWTVNGEKKKCDAYTTVLDKASQEKIWKLLA
ncbi:MAG: hypothetical protein K5641_00655, partial [Lachnospiraceae bacterium]|nr:hypothetical protein [Lachnospiraceae bacterium]